VSLRRRRLAAAPVALSAVVLAACGSGGSTGTSSTSSSTSSSSAASSPSSSSASSPSGRSAKAESAFQLVSDTSSKTATSNARLAITGTLSAAGQTEPLSGDGAYDFVNHRGTINLTLPHVGAIETRVLGGTIYEKLPAQLSGALGGKPWIKIDLAEVSKSLGGSGQLGNVSQGSDPAQVLKYLKGSSQSVTRVGEEQVRGAHTTHYRAQVDLQRAVQQGVFGQATADSFKKQFGTTAFPVDVWIDDQGRASRTSYSMKAVTAGSFSFTQELYDFGKADVSGVTAPRADQTRDISSLTKAAAGTTTG
jgi:hypothetical protein